MRQLWSRAVRSLFARTADHVVLGKFGRAASGSSSLRPALLDTLESRQLLAADIAVSYLSTTLTSQVVFKTTRTGVVTAKLQNLDSVKGPRTRFDIQVMLVPAGQTTGRVVGTLRNQTVSNLSGTASRNVRVPVSLPGTRSPVDKGTYSLVLIADPANKLTEQPGSRANNTSSSTGATTPFTVSVADPFTRISIVSLNTTFPTNATPGTLGTATLTVRNDGNVTARGTIDLSFFGVRQGSTDQVQISDTRRLPISLGAGLSRVVAKNVRVIVPTNTGFSSSTLTVVGTITPNTVGVQDTGNDTTRQTTSSTTVSLPPVSRTNNNPLVPGLGNILTFSLGSTAPFGPVDDITKTRAESNGNVVDNLGRVGKYSWVYTAASANTPSQGLLTLTFPGTGTLAPFTARYRFVYTSATPAFTALVGRSFTLGVTSNAEANLKLTSSLDIDDPNDTGVSIRKN